MQIRVLFFGILKDLTGRASDLLKLPEDATLADVVVHYQGINPRLNELAASIAISINQEFAAADSPLKEGDEIAFLPPVSGGASASGSGGERGSSSIVREKIDTQAVLAKLKQSTDGAAVIFEGVVRDNTRGRRTLYLDYEAYEEMALKQMDALIEQALQQFPIRAVSMVHRLGRLEIGDTSVLIAVASAHRGLRSMRVAGSSIPSSAPCLFGRKSTLKMARYGPMASHSPLASPRPKAAIPKGLHLSEQIIFSRFLRNSFARFVVERHFSQKAYSQLLRTRRNR